MLVCWLELRIVRVRGEGVETTNTVSVAKSERAFVE